MEDLCRYSTTYVFNERGKVPVRQLVYLSVPAEMPLAGLPGLRGDPCAPSLAERAG